MKAPHKHFVYYFLDSIIYWSNQIEHEREQWPCSSTPSFTANCVTRTFTVTVTRTVTVIVTVTVTQTWNLSKGLHRQGFSGKSFTRQSVNYDKCPIATKQQKILENLKWKLVIKWPIGDFKLGIGDFRIWDRGS